MRVLIVSDTHGRNKELREAMKRARPFDTMIHCGDVEGCEDEIRKEAGCPCTIVKGNNDYYSDLPRDEVIYRMGMRIFVAHGHTYHVGWSMETIKEAAKSHGCECIIYGHTHRPVIDRTDPEMLILNPGSLAYPRQEGRQPSFMIMDRDESGNVDIRIEYIGKKKTQRRFW